MERNSNRRRRAVRAGRKNQRKSRSFWTMRTTWEPRKRTATRTRKRSAAANSYRCVTEWSQRKTWREHSRKSCGCWSSAPIAAAGSPRRTGFARSSGKSSTASSTRNGRCGHRENKPWGYIRARRRTAVRWRMSGVRRNRSGWPAGRKRRRDFSGWSRRSGSAGVSSKSNRPTRASTAV